MSTIPWSSNQQVFAPAVYTATQTSRDIQVQYARQIDVVLDITLNAGGAGSVGITVNGKDAVSGKYYPIMVNVAVQAVATNVYKVGIGLPVSANVSANSGVPSVIQIVASGNGSPVTFSVGLNMIS